METKSSNQNLHQANRAKKDEFYTQLADIENELKHYKDQFRGKVIFCNCDDPKESNFVKYFSMKFEELGLKKLIATHYKEANLFTQEPPYKLEYTGDRSGNRMPDPNEFMTEMISDGDFRSKECIELLKESDIVVTNPPFSLFREYVAQLTEYDKKFLIIGNTNAITYKEIFKLIKENKLRTGYTNFNVGMFFIVPDDWELFHHIDKDGKKIARVATSCWYTNMDVKKHRKDITLYKKYSPKEYPKYDNYDAINVDKYTDIPYDYNGVMGVPVTFIDKYNPEQFEIIWTTDRGGDGMIEHIKLPHSRYDAPVVNGKGLYKRILIRNKKVKD